MIGEKKSNEEEENEEEEEDEEDEEEAGQEEEVLDMPPPWSPKLFVNREKFTDRCPNGEKTTFFKKCKVDVYSECKQVDGLVKRITIYKDYKRLITKEIRSYYRCRKDKLLMRRRFPYEFKLVEHYGSQPPYHWKKLIQIDGQYKKLYYYHHRNNDGLILREELIGKNKNKIIEEYKNRPDKLTYRSCSFNPYHGGIQNKDLTLQENNYKMKVPIKKMTQRFDLDPDEPAAKQMRKTEFNFDKQAVYIFYHYEDGKITSNEEEWDRADLLGDAKVDDPNGNEQEETKEQQEKRKIHELELRCHEQVKYQENQALNEINMRLDNEHAIQQLRGSPNPEEIFAKILTKSVLAKAREKMKAGKKKEEETGEVVEKDYLLPILKKCGFQKNEALEEEAAIQVKNEALRSLKERLLTRAEIIQRRLDEEQKNLETAYVSNFPPILTNLNCVAKT